MCASLFFTVCIVAAAQQPILYWEPAYSLPSPRPSGPSALYPPSTGRSVPVMKEASLESRKRTGRATSTVWASLHSMAYRPHSSARDSRSPSQALSTSLVQVQPGDTELTRICFLALRRQRGGHGEWGGSARGEEGAEPVEPSGCQSRMAAASCCKASGRGKLTGPGQRSGSAA